MDILDILTLWPPFGGGAILAPPAVVGDLREALQERLGGSAELAAIVGGRGVYPAILPIATRLPAVTYWVPANPRLHGLRGFHRQAGAEVTINCASWRLADVVRSKAIVEQLLDGRTWTAAGLTVQWSWQDGEEDLHEPPADASDRWLYRCLLTYRVKHLPAS